MKNSEILKRQQQLLKEVDFLANYLTQYERKNSKNVTKKSKI